MATAAKKKTVSRTATVGLKEVTVKTLAEAQTLVGAPDGATLSTNNAGYIPATVVEGEEAAEILPFNVSFTWSEEV